MVIPDSFDGKLSKLMECLSSNRLAAGTQELFNGSIARVLEYVEQGSLIFDDIRDLLLSQLGDGAIRL